jgi:hypothetical protein
MNLTNKELAIGLEVPASRVSEWIKRGMPRTSVQVAATWRQVHARPRKGNVSRVAPPRQPEAESVVTTGTDNGWEARLKRTQESELRIHDTLLAALGAGDFNVLQRLQAAHIGAVKEIAAAEKIALEVRTASEELIHRDTVREIMSELLVPLRGALDRLPLGERTNCNPDHPEIAEAALKDWLHRTLLLCSKAESRFLPKA